MQRIAMHKHAILLVCHAKVADSQRRLGGVELFCTGSYSELVSTFQYLMFFLVNLIGQRLCVAIGVLGIEALR